METKNKIKVTRSNCCYAKLTTNYGTKEIPRGATVFYICKKCKEPCDTVQIYIEKELPDGSKNKFGLTLK